MTTKSAASEAAKTYAMTYAMPGMATAMDESFLTGAKWMLEQAEKLNEASQDYNWKLVEDLKSLLEPK